MESYILRVKGEDCFGYHINSWKTKSFFRVEKYSFEKVHYPTGKWLQAASYV